MKHKKNTNLEKQKKSIMKIFVVINFILIVGFVAFYVFNSNRNISGNVVYDYESSSSGIKDYYNKTINIDYKEGIEKEIEFYVFNTEHKNMKVLITINGELNNSIELNENLVDFVPSDVSKKFVYKFKMPVDIANNPGLHSARIDALEIPNVSPGEAYSPSVSRIASELNVYVPYPGKYVEADLNIMNAEQNATALFSISLINRGKEAIAEAKSRIDIYTLLDERIASIESDSKPIPESGNAVLNAKWDVNSLPGDYVAKYSILYDGNSRVFEKKFAIGLKNITIEGLLVNNFQLGGIAKLQILVENKWNQELKDVFVNLLVYNKNSQVMADIKSATESIPALSKKELIAYWDSAGVEEGEYNSNLKINYENRTVEKNLILKVSSDSLEVFGVGYTIRPKFIEGGTLTNILIIFVIILFIVNLAWFVFYKRIIGNRKKLIIKR